MPVVYLIIGLSVGLLASWVACRRRSSSIPVAGQATVPVSAPAEAIEQRDVPEMAPLSVVLDALPIGVVYADQNGLVVVRNRMATHAAGARHGDIIVNEALEGLLRTALLGEERRQTLDLFGPPARVLLVHAQPAEAGGAIATISDITERARLDAVRTDFVANISHELKTPVGALSLLAEALADSNDPDVVTRLSGKIVKEAERLALAIEDLLELSRIELGGDSNRHELAVVGILEDAADRVRGLAERRHIRLEIQDKDSALSVVGDRRQLVSAIGNLVDNAVKYSEMDSIVRLGVCLNGDRVTFSVSDSGMGIASQHLDRIFERFYRVDRARSRDTGGVGLGLAIVRHVAANHGGEVKVTSQEGEGSTFMLSIPVSRASVAESQEDNPVSAAG